MKILVCSTLYNIKAEDISKKNYPISEESILSKWVQSIQIFFEENLIPRRAALTSLIGQIVKCRLSFDDNEWLRTSRLQNQLLVEKPISREIKNEI